MAKTAEIRENIKVKSQRKGIPDLNTVNGKVVIDPKESKQVKWFAEFKK